MYAPALSAQSIDSISLRMRSCTSRKPPPWGFTCLGLRVCASTALSIFVLSCEGLLGTDPGIPTPELPFRGLADDDVSVLVSPSDSAATGISSYSPDTFSRRRKSGQSCTSIASDSCASATDNGTGDDLMTAAATSGIARRLRAPGVAAPDPAGFEKYLWKRGVGSASNSRITSA